MWELDCEESWVPKNWCFWIVVLEKTLESPFDCKIKPVSPKGNQPCIFTGRTEAEAEAPILWPPDVKKRPRCWERLKAGEADDREWDGWMASPTQWRWVWVSSRSWWWTGKPVVLHSMRLQSSGHDWASELNSALIVWKFCRDVLCIWLGCCPDATLVIWRGTEAVMSASHSHLCLLLFCLPENERSRRTVEN